MIPLSWSDGESLLTESRAIDVGVGRLQIPDTAVAGRESQEDCPPEWFRLLFSFNRASPRCRDGGDAATVLVIGCELRRSVPPADKSYAYLLVSQLVLISSILQSVGDLKLVRAPILGRKLAWLQAGVKARHSEYLIRLPLLPTVC